MFEEVEPLLQIEVDYITDTVAPGGQLVAADRLEGGVSATINYLEFALPDGGTKRVIVRQYGIFDLGDDPAISVHEEELLTLLRQHGLPVPKPLLSEIGFGGPGRTWLVCEYVEGETVTASPFPARFVEQLAETLIALHTFDPGLHELSFLEDGHDETWVQVEANVRSKHLTQAEHDYWQALEVHFPDTPDELQSLLHGDFWPGNVIWKDGKIAALIDWEDAHLGDPLEDVANCRLELFLIGGAELADAFADAYRRLRPETKFDGQHFWELYAAARFLLKVPTWELDEVEKESMVERAETFATRAHTRLMEA
jgi:aminoglycoside phosphotransferase (APT) family kinase protein